VEDIKSPLLINPILSKFLQSIFSYLAPVKKFLSIFLVFSACCFAQATTVNIGILSNIKVTTVIITPLTGNYNVVADGRILYRLKNQGLVQLTLHDNYIETKTLNRVLGSFNKVELVAVGKNCSFHIRSVVPARSAGGSGKRSGTYDDNLEVSIHSWRLQLVNRVDLDKYVAGVVESEVGKKRTAEFYKVQSIICRTYALSNSRRHEDEGFHLCDKVHCQVYRGKCKGVDSYNILKVVLLTSGIVVVDRGMELITATFHSNCGGQTVNSEDVWMLSKPYLKSIKDPFCTDQFYARWEKKIPTEDWIQYLSAKYSYPVEEGKHYAYAINYAPKEREAYFADDPNIPLKFLRSDWRLRSTYFSISAQGEAGSDGKQGNGILTFRGRGNGHGVGLCQEGAIHMAEKGYSYREILHFYYTGVYLLHISALVALLK